MSIAAVSGCLIVSEVLFIPLCSLCWWQRVFWFPLVVVFAVGLGTKELRATRWTGLVLGTAGFFTALYHVVLQEQMFGSDGLIPCSSAVSCTDKVLLFPEPFHWLTMPMVSLTGFTVVLISMITLFWSARAPKAAVKPSETTSEK